MCFGSQEKTLAQVWLHEGHFSIIFFNNWATRRGNPLTCPPLCTPLQQCTRACFTYSAYVPSLRSPGKHPPLIWWSVQNDRFLLPLSAPVLLSKFWLHLPRIHLSRRLWLGGLKYWLLAPQIPACEINLWGVMKSEPGCQTKSVFAAAAIKFQPHQSDLSELEWEDKYKEKVSLYALTWHFYAVIRIVSWYTRVSSLININMNL